MPYQLTPVCKDLVFQGYVSLKTRPEDYLPIVTEPRALVRFGPLFSVKPEAGIKIIGKPILLRLIQQEQQVGLT